jgi:hypothetical protein
MLRNLNQRANGQRICGTSHSGIKGALIPALSAIRNLSSPTDDTKDYKLRLTAWPASGNLFMFEDGTSVFTPANDGTYTATGQIVENGIDVGAPVTITYQSGVAGTTVACSAGAASATGASASIQRNVTVSASVGTAAATGAQASIQGGTTINASVGTASATGAQANVTNAGGATIACAVGNASASGAPASISRNVTINATAGNAAASGATATVTNAATGVVISCSVGVASATGVLSAITGGTDTTPYVSSSRTVNFGGGTNRVDFDGGTNRVNF